MNRTTVQSSMISEVGYDSATMTLEVQFKPGQSVWSYAGVPADVAQEFISSKSIGKYFLEKIKNKYQATAGKA